MEILHKYLEILWNSFQYDVNVFSQAWIYYWALVPAIGYLIFFILKWFVLTAPFWLPFVVVMRAANLPSPKCENCVYRTAQEDIMFETDKKEEKKTT